MILNNHTLHAGMLVACLKLRCRTLESRLGKDKLRICSHTEPVALPLAGSSQREIESDCEPCLIRVVQIDRMNIVPVNSMTVAYCCSTWLNSCQGLERLDEEGVPFDQS